MVEGVAVGRAPAFRGRARERAALDGMLDRVREGESAVLVMRGEAGIGKTALMQYCARQASGCRVAQIAGVESELEMPFAAVHQLCEPMLGHLDALPEPQQQALQVAFGLAAGNTPDRFVVGLAVLGLLAEVAAERPLVCLVDDAQWLDEPSRQVLGFVGRRLLAEAVLLLLRGQGSRRRAAVSRPAEPDARGAHRGRRASAARWPPYPASSTSKFATGSWPRPAGTRLRLLELPREMSSGELAGGFGVPRTGTPSGPMEEHYTRRIRALPEPTQQLLLLAAADPTGDATLLWRAARALGIARTAAAAAESEQLIEIGSHVRFRHPLVRSAAYAAGTAWGSLRRARGARRGDGCPSRSGAARLASGRCGHGAGRGRRLGTRGNGRRRLRLAPGWRRRRRSSSVRCS